MAILFDKDASPNQCLGIDNTPVINSSAYSSTNYSFSVSCWFKPNGRHNGAVFEQYDNSSGNGRLGLYFLSNGKIRLRYHNSYLTSDEAEISTSTTTWYHMVGFWEYSERGLYLNNVLFDSYSGGTDPHWTSSSNPTGNKSNDHDNSAVEFDIGSARSGSVDSTIYYFDGEIAEFAAYSTKLNTGEVASLYAGASPLMVRGDKLLAYYPLGGPYVGTGTDVYRDIIGGNNLSATGSPTFAATPNSFGDNSAMFYPYSGPIETIKTYAAAPEEVVSTRYTEADITGDDVIAEIIQANPRHQGRMTVNNGGIAPVTLNKNSHQNKNYIVAENYITNMNARLVKPQEIKGSNG